ncbi:glycosyltransferase [Dethiobacter alkaliphilus]|uniref:glycosyltransferase n=1 Tax=Dethiobacter alkaliphilus TaxID=427926 RepID=UPI00222606C5|nr:glycosyltransferase [Dethiobacter alkaliphilus]MCW3489256.1 glycosyltransferase [Dethiobacter alkaliphilus]
MLETLQCLDFFIGKTHEKKSLKILFVIDHLVKKGGFESYLVETINGLTQYGHTIYLDYRKLSKDFKESLPASTTFLNNLPLKKLINYVQKEGIDVIQGQPFYALERSYQLSCKSGIPYVITWHGRYKMTNAAKYIDAAEKIIAVSEEIKAVLISQYPPAEEKIVVIQNGINLKQFLPSDDAVVHRENGLKLLFLGRLDTDRAAGVSKLAEACRNLNYALTVCGNGKDKKQLEKNWGKSVLFCGDVINPAPFIRNADVVAATGRGCREALASGKPCMIISSMGYDGIVFPHNYKKVEYANYSGRGMSQAVDTDLIKRDLKMLEKAEIREKLGLFGRELAKSYDIKLITEQTTIVYQQAITNKKLPKVSIILPVYNHAHELRDAMQSILAQTYTDFEVLVINDGSEDHPEKTLALFNDHRIRYYKNQTNKKLPYSLNRGLLEARGKYITWTSADNLLENDFLKVLVSALDSKPEFGAAYSDYIQIDKNGKKIRQLSKGIYRLTGRLNFGPSFLYRREAVLRAGFFDQNLYGIEDVDYSTRLAIEAPVLWVPQVLYKYRVHRNSITGRIRSKKENIVLARKVYKTKWQHLLKHPQPSPGKNQRAEGWKTVQVFNAGRDCSVNVNHNKNIDAFPLLLGSTPKKQYKCLLYFDLSSVPPNSKIISASLELFVYRNANSKPKKFCVNPITEQWQEQELHSGNMPEINNKVQTVGLSSPPQSWMVLDVTEIALGWLKGAYPNCGLLISPTEKQISTITMYNRHNGSNLLQPRLRLVYTGKNRGEKISTL